MMPSKTGPCPDSYNLKSKYSNLGRKPVCSRCGSRSYYVHRLNKTGSAHCQWCGLPRPKYSKRLGQWVDRDNSVEMAQLNKDVNLLLRRYKKITREELDFQDKLNQWCALNAHIEKEISKTEKDAESIKKQLANSNFVSRAPPDVVEEFRIKLVQAEDKLRRLNVFREGLCAIRDNWKQRDPLIQWVSHASD